MPSGTTRLIFERADGGVSVDVPVRVRVDEDDPGAGTVDIADRPARLQAHVARLEAEHGWTHRKTVTVAELPRRHPHTRDAWRWDGAAIAVDLPAARANTLRYVAAERERRLARELDPARRDAIVAAANVGAAVAQLNSAAALEAWAVPWPTPPDGGDG